jgi:PEGA domain/Stigma-specific protein, Stig1
MRILAIFLLLCLLAALPASAVSLNPAVVPELTKVSSTVRPAVTMIPGRTVVTMPADVWMTVRITSMPSGASVYTDSSSTASGTTPLNLGLRSGSHTIRLSLAGYQDYTTTVTVIAGGQLDDLVVNLVPVPKLVTSRQNVPVLMTPEVLHTINRTIIPRATVTPESVDSCVSGQKCLTLSDAAATYAPDWWYIEGAVCGHAILANDTSVPKYCTGGSPRLDAQKVPVSAGIPVPTGLMVNAVSVSASPTLQPVETPKVLGAKRQVGLVESVLGFFNGIFSHPVCAGGKTACGTTCVDLMNDSMNCGYCDFTCFDPAVCIAGECDYAPPPWSNPVGDIIL